MKHVFYYWMLVISIMLLSGVSYAQEIDSKNDASLEIPKIQHRYCELKARAFLNPTKENVLQYQVFLKNIHDRSVKFANTVINIINNDPALKSTIPAMNTKEFYYQLAINTFENEGTC
ncbi:MAG: hypothetical protein A3F42_07410 [Gammaproteobacteria bacterium RIFCSPHIGHO2_12_FULL_37_34]|nr:MAG: hypothetical protein A3F42_07410 [Gammaproteobacteria bacterium RIFCSPHIGHO2_12_FULL_37_34]